MKGDRGQWWKEPLIRLVLTMKPLTGEQRRRILLYVADCLKKSEQKERARARRVVRQLGTFYTKHHAEWLAKAGNRPLVQSFKAKADACDELLRRLS
jgi:hypothetical protein